MSSGICQERDPAVLREIFASWPSGHSSFSFAGLLYLSLFLCAKFSVGIPYLLPVPKTAKENTYDYDERLAGASKQAPSLNSQSKFVSTNELTSDERAPPPRNSTAAPPIYLLLLAVFLPIGSAIYICISRWFDFHHHGIDILTGALLGATSAWFSFRYYHAPVLIGSGWAWGARSRGRAFWAGVGRDSYVGDEGWLTAKSSTQDIEAGRETHGIKDGDEEPEASIAGITHLADRQPGNYGYRERTANDQMS